MARARVQDHVDTLEGLGAARPHRDPRVLADLEADAHTVAVEVQVAKGVARALDVDLGVHAGRPGLEPARLVVDAVARQETLRHEPRDGAVAAQGHAVEDGVVVGQGEAEAGDHARRARQQLVERVQRAPVHVGREEHVFAAVTRQAHLGQAEDAHASVPRLVEGERHAGGVAAPVEGHLVQNGGAYMK